MVSIDDFHRMLEAAAAELPHEIFTRLNGGVALSPEAKRHPKAVGDDLYILGEYRASRALGRSIILYYGSFERTFGHLPEDALRVEIDRTLRHELLHHLEGMAGEDGLVREDRSRMRAYLERKEGGMAAPRDL